MSTGCNGTYLGHKALLNPHSSKMLRAQQVNGLPFGHVCWAQPISSKAMQIDDLVSKDIARNKNYVAYTASKRGGVL